MLFAIVSWISGGNDTERQAGVREEILRAFNDVREAEEKKDQYDERYLKKHIATIERVEFLEIGGRVVVRIYYYSFWGKLTSHFNASVEIRPIVNLNKTYDEKGWVPAALVEHVIGYEHVIYLGQSDFLRFGGLRRVAFTM
ncbi:hypothetical protein [Desulfonatronum parangueonense]